jgi:hypothetical protein
MTALTNSRRRLDKVTYTPLLLAAGDSGGALETAAAVGALGLQPGEAAAAGAAPAAAQTSARVQAVLRDMDALAAAVTAAERLALSARLATNSGDVLGGAVGAIKAQRDRALAETLSDMRALVDEYRRAHQDAAAATGRAALEERVAMMEREVARLSPAIGATRTAATATRLNPFAETSADLSPPRFFAPMPTSAPSVPASGPPLPAGVAQALGNAAVPDASAAAAWADASRPERAQHLVSIAAVAVPAELRTSAAMLLASGLPFLIDQDRRTATVKGHLTSRALQPLGVLHLEQLVITPQEVERGELTYSLPLAPRERVTLSHKEWSLRQEEYSRFVQDHLENYSEQGVAEKTDIAVSSKSETEHSKTLSMSQPSAPGGATVAERVDAQPASVDVTKETQSQEQSRRDTREITQKASALTIRDQKISFTVSTISGSSDFTSRLYENHRDDKVMVIDYFRRMRKWHHQLFRIGIRLTYDVVLPDPGRRLRERWRAVADIDARLATDFRFELSPGERSVSGGVASFVAGKGLPTFALASAAFASITTDIEKMSVEDIERTARSYGVSLPPAPNTLTGVEETKAITDVPPPGKNSVSFTLALSIPADYRPVRLWIGGRLALQPPGAGEQYLIGDYWERTVTVVADEKVISRPFAVPDGESTSQKLSVDFIAYNGATGEARAFATLVPTPDAWRKWRSQAFLLIRQGAVNRWNEQREMLRQQRAGLLKELNAPDALALRRMEREQVMFLVLEWLFPEFGQSTEVYQALGASKPTAWQAVLEYGEYAKFIHDAIDWDRILVLLYPYFWDRPENHPDKLYLDHPDGTHREFLRAGACRVVLAIKPGFEEEVISLLDQGVVGRLTPASRFSKVVGQVVAAEKAFAKARAESTAPAKTDQLERESGASYGALLGEWLEWTPTSAIDMDVTLRDLL